MAVKMITFPTREAWLQGRGHTIGGSDASAVIGLNPWKSNVDLFNEKTGRTIPKEIESNPYIEYGQQAERHLRGLFRLDFPQYRVEYVENNIWINDKYPWAHYSADGWMFETVEGTQDVGRLGVLEIKTTEILKSMQKEKWRGQIPDNYFVQVLHGMAVMEAEFAVLKAQLKTVFDDVPYLQTKHYYIERHEVQDQIDYLMESERKFWLDTKQGRCPALILPEI